MNYKKYSYWLPVLLWMGIIFTLSSFEAAVISRFDLLEFLFKKTIHMIEYGILWHLIHRAFVQTTKLPKFQTTIYSLLATILYAGTDEFHQTLIPTRHGTYTDVIIDSIGATIALYLHNRH